MDRAEHLQWCKDRANACLDTGDIPDAFASMTSDMNKHEETANSAANTILIQLGMMYVMNHDSQGMRGWINGFN